MMLNPDPSQLNPSLRKHSLRNYYETYKKFGVILKRLLVGRKGGLVAILTPILAR